MLEVEKYEALWDRKEYRNVAPGEGAVLSFLTVADPEKGEDVIDFGCGTGRGAKRLQEAGLKVTGLDFARNCLDDDVSINFVQHDLTKPVEVSAKYGFCTDVMEHIPPAEVPLVLYNVTRAAKFVYFQIACTDDVMGALIGEPLHLTVENHDWWKEKLESIGCKVLWSQDFGGACCFYVSCWSDASALIKNGKLNISDETLKENIRVNCSKGYKTAEPCIQQDVEIMLLGGGPSLNDFEDQIKANREKGMPLVTTNGTYNWCPERGLKPSAQIMVDARPFNKRFLLPVTEGCKYLLASQCDPEAVESVPKEQVYLWHSVTGTASSDYIESVSDVKTWPIPGGSTVVLRAIPLLRMLGFAKIHIYGFDSCVMGEHHSYAQPENDNEIMFKVRTKGREFLCAPWMVSQAEEFKTLVAKLDDDCQLAVYGDGLIAHILNSAAIRD